MLKFLNSLGFGDGWYNSNTDTNYSYIFKQWICDQYLQACNTSMQKHANLKARLL